VSPAGPTGAAGGGPTGAAAERPFGRALLREWLLDPGFTHLNHGTVGATPRRVLAAQQAIRDEIERQPPRYLLRELAQVGHGMPGSWRPRLRAAAETVAGFLGASGDDVVFVDNATTGINAVLRSLELRAGDEILLTDLGYGAIANAAGYVARRSGAIVRAVEMPFPIADPGAAADAIVAALTPRTRLAIVDHVTSESALVLPLAGIAACCRARGVAVLGDGAHAPGALPLDIPSLGVDWYVANLHKWALAPRSCGILWAPPARQAELHPAVISWGLDQGFTAEFDWVGTRDPSAYLAAPEGIAFMEDLGIDAMRAYQHGLAWDGARRLTERWGTGLAAPESMAGPMVTVPLPERAGNAKEDATRLRDALLFEDRIEIQLHAWRGRLWVRLSAQVYNEMADVERLAGAVLARL
jgi:isopenicillin-N epimerase